MVLKRWFYVMIFILIVALLGACVRSASTPPVNLITPLPEGEKGVEEAPVESPAQPPASGSNEVLQQLELFVTQTAAAAQVVGGQPVQGQQPDQPAVEGTPGSPAEDQETAQTAEASAGLTETGEAAEGGTAQPGQTEQQPGAQEPSPVAQQPAQPGQQPQPTQPVQPAQPAQPEPTRIVVPTATPGIPSKYTLQPGEFVYCIARRFNVNPFELLSINGLSTNSVVRGGTTLTIPKTGNPFPGERSLKAHPTTYVVSSGENIYEIACLFGSVSPEAIAYANGLKSPFTLSAGQKLYIP